MATNNPVFTVGSSLRLPFGHQQRYDVLAIDNRDSGVFYRFNLLSGGSFTAHKWYEEQLLRKLNPVLFVTPVLTVVRDQTAPLPQARAWATKLRMAAGKVVFIPAGCKVGATDDDMRKRADSAARYVFALANETSGDERCALALAGGLLIGAAQAPDRDTLLAAAATARVVLVKLGLEANVKVIAVNEGVAA